MRVAILHTPMIRSGGAERQMLHMAREVERLGHQVTIFTQVFRPEACFPDLVNGLEVKAPPTPFLSNTASKAMSALRVPAAGAFCVRYLGTKVSKEYDVINCHSFFMNWAAAVAKKKIGTPAVWMCNEPPYWYYDGGWVKRLLKLPEGIALGVFDISAAQFMDRIVVLDRKTQARVLRYYHRESEIVRTGVDAEYFGGNVSPAELPVKDLGDRFVVLQVGHIAPIKGQHTSVRMVKALEQEIPALHLVIVGHRANENLGPLVRELGLGARVTLLDRASEIQLRALYSRADVVVFPADYTWGLTIAEGMAAGKAVIASDASGVSEVVEDGRTGFVIPHGDLAIYAQRVATLARDERLRTRMGAAGRSFVRETLTWPNYARGMIRQFEKAIDGS